MRQSRVFESFGISKRAAKWRSDGQPGRRGGFWRRAEVRFSLGFPLRPTVKPKALTDCEKRR